MTKIATYIERKGPVYVLRGNGNSVKRIHDSEECRHLTDGKRVSDLRAVDHPAKLPLSWDVCQTCMNPNTDDYE